MTVFTYSVIVLNVILSYLGFNNELFFLKYSFTTKDILKGKEYFRLVSSAFLHGNLAHLFFNMFSFYSFGVYIEESFGIKIIAVIYIYSLLGGNLLSLLINRKKMDYRSIGASGAVSGVIFASIFLLPGSSIYIFPIPVALPSWMFAIIFVGISMFGMGNEKSKIGHDAHIGGALTGILWAVLYKPEIIFHNSLLLMGIVIPLVLFLVIYIVNPNLVNFNSRK